MGRAPNIAGMDPSIAPLADRIRAAAADRTPLLLRGGGTKDFYGNAPSHASPAPEVLDTRACSGIVSYEPSELVVTARCGTPLAELEAALAERGQCLAFEPPHFTANRRGDSAAHVAANAPMGATVGGMVAAGLAGPARAASGSVRDFMLGVTLIDGRGEELVFGGQVMKNVAGYDVSRLMAGSLGTLALIAEVSLKVLPSAPAEATLRIDNIAEAEAITRLNRWGGQPLPLNASCWAAGTLWLRLRGARAAVDEAVSSMGGTSVADAAQTPWLALREQTHPFFDGPESLWRISVPDSTPPFGNFLAGHSQHSQHSQHSEMLIEWNGAQRWLRRPASDAAAIRDAAMRAGGHASLFRPGDAVAQAGTQVETQNPVEVFTPLAPAVMRIHVALKREFDPAGIFGRGRLYRDL